MYRKCRRPWRHSHRTKLMFQLTWSTPSVWSRLEMVRPQPKELSGAAHNPGVAGLDDFDRAVAGGGRRDCDLSGLRGLLSGCSQSHRHLRTRRLRDRRYGCEKRETSHSNDVHRSPHFRRAKGLRLPNRQRYARARQSPERLDTASVRPMLRVRLKNVPNLPDLDARRHR